MKARQSMAGFTLLEIMVVVIIIGLIAAAIVPNLIGQGESAKVELTKADMSKIVQQLDLYKFSNGSYPSSDEGGLMALVERPPSARKWPDGGYLPKLPLDAWNNKYDYISPGKDTPFELYSMGADGVEGGEGANADINWHEIR